jgi:hypothetical protein
MNSENKLRQKWRPTYKQAAAEIYRA